jgi:hypothetical protein
MKKLLTSIAVLLCVAAHAGQKQTSEAESPLYDMQELLDASTLDVEVLQEWYVDYYHSGVVVKSIQSLRSANQITPDQELRIGNPTVLSDILPHSLNTLRMCVSNSSKWRLIRASTSLHDRFHANTFIQAGCNSLFFR